MSNALQHVKRTDRGRGGVAVVYYCALCPSHKPYIVKIPRGVGKGRGFGLATSSMARAEVVKHIREDHADKL